jgi:hypothetical protein
LALGLRICLDFVLIKPFILCINTFLGVLINQY